MSEKGNLITFHELTLWNMEQGFPALCPNCSGIFQNESFFTGPALRLDLIYFSSGFN